jgi:hypothetical protein
LKRQHLFRLVGSPHQDIPTGRGCLGRSFFQHTSLADPGLTCQEHCLRLSFPGLFARSSEPRDFSLASDERDLAGDAIQLSVGRTATRWRRRRRRQRVLQDFLVQTLGGDFRLYTELAAQNADATLVLAQGCSALPSSDIEAHHGAMDVLP